MAKQASNPMRWRWWDMFTDEMALVGMFTDEMAHVYR